MTTFTPTRHPAGAPGSSGGRFAPTGRAESDLELADQAGSPAPLQDLLDAQSRAEREAWRHVSLEEWRTGGPNIRRANPHSMGVLVSAIRAEHPEATGIRVLVDRDPEDGVTDARLTDVYRKGGRIQIGHRTDAMLDDKIARIDWRDFLDRFSRNCDAGSEGIKADETVADHFASTGEAYIDLDRMEQVATRRTGIPAPRLAGQPAGTSGIRA